jgi:GAF domain-containing protein/anti-sigma regulatory factor (Ser/Thr protein kinase)
MSLTRKAPTAAKKHGKLRRQDLAEALAEREAELAEARRQNARLFDELHAKTRDLSEALQQQSATADVLKVISRSAFDLDAVFDALLASAVSLIGGRGGTICVRDGEVFRYRADAEGRDSAMWRYLSEHPATPGRASVAGRVLLSGKPETISDTLSDSELKAPVHALTGSRSVVGVPLLRDDRVEGALMVGRAEAGLFDSRHIELLQTFADQAVIAIENARLFDEVQARTRDLEEALQQQSATADVLKVISRSAFDLKAVLGTLVQSVLDLCNASGGNIHLRDGDTFRLEMQLGWPAEFAQYMHDHPITPGTGSVSGRAILTGAVAHIPDVLEDRDYSLSEGPKLVGYRALLGIPLLRQDEVIGVFSVGRPTPGPFTERQIELVRTFADQAVIAIENVRLFDQVQAKTRDLEEALQQQTATADVLKVISRSAFDLQVVLDTLVGSAATLCEAEKASIFQRRGDLYHWVSNFGFSDELVAYAKMHPFTAGSGSTTSRVARSRAPVHIPDVLADPNYMANEYQRLGDYRTILGVPLLRDGEPIGVFIMTRHAVRPFNGRQIELLQTFADQAVIAIENTRLFDEVQARTHDLEEALQQQIATADVLKAISRSAFDLDTVLETLITTALRLCDATYGEIFRRHGDFYRYAASRMDVDPAYLHHERAAEIAPGRGTLVGRVALGNRAVEIVDAWNDPEYAEKEEARVGNVRAMLGVPLMRNGEPVGAFALGRAEPVPFTQRQIDLVTTFADQAVIAIENVRLFDEVQAKTRDLEESLQQQTATAEVLKVISRSAFDLQAVLTTLAESARELCGASFVTLFMREADEMRLRAESGCTPQIVAFLRAHPIRAGRETFTGRVMLSREAVHLPDVLADPEYDFGDAPRIGNYRALLGVPLLRNGQVEGVFALARPEPAPFSARQIEMVRAFADQAVIAIENSRLFEEVQARTRELAASLDDLRKAQDRLIQSEKLASLGQLTAGIAHEIKNPLNFVNNYSALSRELVGELAEAIKGSAVNEAAGREADELIGAISGNLDKIVQHGKRADSIVKNMLLHSREGSGERATTNINTMVEEALNLAYHGARAEKPGFNVTIMKSLDPNAGAAEVYAQEMTRVLLNLISNGFYATTRRKQSVGDGAYEPTIVASTRDLGPKVEIAIRDNGTGVSDEVKAKMFNPFFTTKPAGEGTGLGLSLSHDIVVKQHGGAIEVSTEPDAFTEFTIVLPRGVAQR